MSAVVYVNGTIARGDAASIPIFDHGFLYGEGIYETLRTYHREPFLFERHAQRLRRSAAFMALTLPWTNADLLARVRETMDAHGDLSEAYIRILVTRGIGDLSYNPAATPVPSLVIIVKPYVGPPAASFTDGITLSLVSIRRNHPQALNPAMKSNNLLNNALAMQEALRAGAEEALMLNQAGAIVECSQSNVFVVRNGEALTPPLEAGLLPGITREFVMELARDIGVPAREATVMPDDLRSVDEVFLTGTTREVTPVVAIDGLKIGSGKPGAVTKALLARFHAAVAAPAAVK